MVVNKKLVLFSVVLSSLLTGVSYLVNNAGQCCDLIFQAGWPWPFYGGSGGFTGYQENRLILSGLILNLAFWFVISFVFLAILSYLLPFLKGFPKRPK